MFIFPIRGATGSIVAVTNGTLSLDGFTITGGTGSVFSSTQGGGVAVTHTTGGATPYTPNLTLTDCDVRDNEASYGGGIAIRSYGWLSLIDTRVDDNTGDSAGGALWMQDYGTLECSASALGDAGFAGNTSAIAGAIYLSNGTSGNIDAVGCDWGDDASGDDNATYDIQQAPAASNVYCYPNATALTETISCADGGCTASTDATCP